MNPLLVAGLVAAGLAAIGSVGWGIVRQRKLRQPMVGMKAKIALVGRPAVLAPMETIPAKIPLYALEAEPPSAPALRVWGYDIGDTGATYRPDYLRSKQCHHFYWGFCAKDFIDELAKQTPKAAAAYDLVHGILLLIFPAAKVAEWITKNFCLIFDFELKVWEDQYGNSGWEIGRWYGGLGEHAPPSPLPPRKGWHRVWVQKNPSSSSTRNETVVNIVFSRADGEVEEPVKLELCSGKELRGMLRMNPKTTGAIDIARLAWAGDATRGCGESKFSMAARKTAMKYFK